MSLWVCPDHGLYGGQVFCPQCGKNGEWWDGTFQKEKPVNPHIAARRSRGGGLTLRVVQRVAAKLRDE